MPITPSGQGFSKNTSAKQEQFRYFIDIHLGICKGIFERNRNKAWLSHKYHYIDLNAGIGIFISYKGPKIFLKTHVSVLPKNSITSFNTFAKPGI